LYSANSLCRTSSSYKSKSLIASRISSKPAWVGPKSQPAKKFPRRQPLPPPAPDLSTPPHGRPQSPRTPSPSAVVLSVVGGQDEYYGDDAGGGADDDANIYADYTQKQQEKTDKGGGGGG